MTSRQFARDHLKLSLQRVLALSLSQIHTLQSGLEAPHFLFLSTILLIVEEM